MSEEKSMTPEGLLSCPFCGDSARRLESGYDHWIVACVNHHCSVEAYVMTEDPEEAVKLWNIRPADPRIAELEAALKKSREYIQTVECWHDGKADQLPIKAEHDLDLDCDCDQCVLLTIIDALIGKEGK